MVHRLGSRALRVALALAAVSLVACEERAEFGSAYFVGDYEESGLMACSSQHGMCHPAIVGGQAQLMPAGAGRAIASTGHGDSFVLSIHYLGHRPWRGDAVGPAISRTLCPMPFTRSGARTAVFAPPTPALVCRLHSESPLSFTDVQITGGTMTVAADGSLTVDILGRGTWDEGSSSYHFVLRQGVRTVDATMAADIRSQTP